MFEKLPIDGNEPHNDKDIALIFSLRNCIRDYEDRENRLTRERDDALLKLQLYEARQEMIYDVLRRYDPKPVEKPKCRGLVAMIALFEFLLLCGISIAYSVG